MHSSFYTIRGISTFFFILTAMLSLSSPAFAREPGEEMEILRMFYKEEDLIVTTPTRSPKPLSRVAENTTVVTAEEMRRINAHTVADVLFFVTGLQIDKTGGPGSIATPYVQGSEFRHVLVMVDGVAVNNLSDSVADIGSMPVQYIEKIEIIKGPSSSTWGSSLGGVINIVTKSPDESRTIGGVLYGSYGERNTGEVKAQASGRVGDIGYYFSAGNLVSGGLRPNTDFYGNNFYGKLKWHVAKKADLTLTLGYQKGDRGAGVFDPISARNDFEYLFSTLSLDYRITDWSDLNLSLRTSRQNTELRFNMLGTGENLDLNHFDDRTYGASARLTARKGSHTLVMGADYDDGTLESNVITGEERTIEKWAVFANDSIELNGFTITPGLRYDHTSTNGDFLSPSIGVTYALGEKTILRGYVARGFSIPSLSQTFGDGFFSVPNPDLGVEKVWSYQLGIETARLKHLWVKATLFRHDISDAISSEGLPDGTFRAVNRARQSRQGIEAEVRTAPWHHTSLSAGFAFIDAEDRKTGDTLRDVPRYTYDLGILYDDQKSFTALLKGHYVWWNASRENDGKYHAFIWDLNVAKKVFSKDLMSAEVFVSGHNLLNGSQYRLGVYKNPGRWVEAGLRIRF